MRLTPRYYRFSEKREGTAGWTILITASAMKMFPLYIIVYYSYIIAVLELGLDCNTKVLRVAPQEIGTIMPCPQFVFIRLA